MHGSDSRGKNARYTVTRDINAADRARIKNAIGGKRGHEMRGRGTWRWQRNRHGHGTELVAAAQTSEGQQKNGSKPHSAQVHACTLLLKFRNNSFRPYHSKKTESLIVT